MTNRTIALIPLRGGSKGIPGKNIRPIGGKPLCAWTIEAALGAPGIDAVYVSTEDPDIAKTAKQVSNRVQILKRPEALASDTASTESVMLHCAEHVEFEQLVLIQATSPLLQSKDLQGGLELFFKQSCDSLLSGVVQKRFFWKLDGTPLNYDPLRRPRRQEWDGSLVENGAFYITRRGILETYRCRLGGKVGVYAMDESTYVEIDDLRDWDVVDGLLKSKSCSGIVDSTSSIAICQRLQNIRLVMVDVDGTLTDAGMYYDSRGEALKKFNTRDAAGLKMLEEEGVTVVIVTREDSAIAASRAKKLNLPFKIGVSDKREAIESLSREYGVALNQIAVIGDDVYDLPAMEVAGYSVCPKDAMPQVIAKCDMQTSLGGGHGAVREFCEVLLASKRD